MVGIQRGQSAAVSVYFVDFLTLYLRTPSRLLHTYAYTTHLRTSKSRLDHIPNHIHISFNQHYTSKGDCTLLATMTAPFSYAMDYPLGVLYPDVLPRQIVMRTEDSTPRYSGVLPELIDGPYSNAINVDVDTPVGDLDCYEESSEKSSYGRSRRLSIGSIEDDDRYGRLNAFIPRDGVTYISTGSNSPITDSTFSQECVCYIRNCERCTSDHLAPSPRASESLPAAARDPDPDRVDLPSDPVPGQNGAADHGTSSLPRRRRRGGRVRFCEPGRSSLRSRFFNSATRRLSNLFPNEPTPEPTPLNDTGAAGPPPTGKPGFFERLACFGRSRRQ